MNVEMSEGDKKFMDELIERQRKAGIDMGFSTEPVPEYPPVVIEYSKDIVLFQLRIPKDVHLLLKYEAAKQGTSMHKLIMESVKAMTEGRPIPTPEEVSKLITPQKGRIKYLRGELKQLRKARRAMGREHFSSIYKRDLHRDKHNAFWVKYGSYDNVEAQIKSIEAALDPQTPRTGPIPL